MCLCSYLLRGRSVQHDSDGREKSAAGNEQGAESVPGAGCGWSEGRDGGSDVTPDRGCVGGGGCCRCFLHQESAGRSRQSVPAGWIHQPSPSNLLVEKSKNTSISH